MKRFDVLSFRNDKQLTQIQLADILGCKQSFISSIETKTRKIPAEKLAKIEEVFGDVSAYISDNVGNIVEEPEDEEEVKSAQKSPDISNISPSKDDYVNVPTKIFDELTKLTETIYSQQRTIENLVNARTN